MKKVLLTGAALVAVATSPAMAEGLKLDLAGHAKVYGVYTDADTSNTRELNLRKETELHFTGETTLDSGLTVGAHVELEVDADDDANSVEESYIYMSGGWGRVNVGEEDGVAYLLQVAAPSADSNVDGLRQYISASEIGRLDYDQTASVSKANKVSYMTPVFNGFQAGVSYIPSIGDSANGTTSTATGSDEGYEVAGRYEGAYEGVGVAFGAGYGDYNGELPTVETDAWNVGLDLDFAGFGVGVAYLDEDGATTQGTTAVDNKETFVVGADYQMGAYTLGVSYLNLDADMTAGGDLEVERYTAGASYSYGPGMSFRGSVSFGDAEATGASDSDETQILLGTQINF